MLTPKGLATLRDYVARPAHFPRLPSEPALRLLAADLSESSKTIDTLRGLLRGFDELDHELTDIEQAADEVAHRAHYLRLSHSLPRRLIAARREWAHEVIASLEHAEPSARQRSARQCSGSSSGSSRTR